MSSKRALLATTILTLLPLIPAQSSNTGTTTRYWDCCKPSCAWPSTSLKSTVTVCDAHDKPLSPSAGVSASSGCTSGGTAYMCSSQSPWAVSPTLAYGFAAVSSANSADCCACYKLTFTDTAVKGKTMIVQATNTGGDVGGTQFDLAMPGGGFGMFDGCTTEWGATDAVWGARYGGPSSDTCGQFPEALQAGCGFRWDWMQGADNPAVEWEMVQCPAEIVAKSGCEAVGSVPVAGGASSSSSSVAAGGASSVASVVGSSAAESQVTASSAAPAGQVSSSPIQSKDQSSPTVSIASSASAIASPSVPEYGTLHQYPAHRYRPLSTAKSAPSLSTAADAEATVAAGDDDEQDECEL